jgi:sugar fermentation stimulation protein A
MNFENELISGLFVKRYKRFFVDVIIDKKIVTAHCPNTGSMQGLLIKNNKVWLTKSNDPKRKLKYTLQIIECNGSKVGVNTHLTNKIVLDALKNNKIKNFKAKEIKTEVKFGDNTRFDFLITDSNSKKFIEVKNVTLSRTNKLAEFPDAVTSRGAKHIDELIKAKIKGYDVYLIFVIQRDDCNHFSIARDIDPKYADLLSDAVKKKLNILCYDCKFSPKGIKLNKQIKIKI